MKIHQISVFVENKSGSLNGICQTLKENNIDIKTLSLADTQQFGILRLIVREWEKAQKVLTAAGYVVKITEVFALRVGGYDCPGGLADVLDTLAKHDVNVEYMYAFAFGSRDNAVLIFCFEDAEKAERALRETRVEAISAASLLS